MKCLNVRGTGDHGNMQIVATAWSKWEPMVIGGYPGIPERAHPVARQSRSLEYFIGGLCIARITEIQHVIGVCQYVLWHFNMRNRFPDKFGSLEDAEGALIGLLEEV